jgi:hypothetical protein
MAILVKLLIIGELIKLIHIPLRTSLGCSTRC